MTIGAILRLAYYFFKRLIVRALVRSDGVARFQANYGVERLLPLSPTHRASLAKFSGCLACGLCDATFTEYERASRADFRGPSDLPLSYSRSLPEYDALDPYLAQIRRGDLAALEAVCPAGIPFRALVASVQEHASSMPRGERPAPALPRPKSGRFDPG